MILCQGATESCSLQPSSETKAGRGSAHTNQGVVAQHTEQQSTASPGIFWQVWGHAGKSSPQVKSRSADTRLGTYIAVPQLTQGLGFKAAP